QRGRPGLRIPSRDRPGTGAGKCRLAPVAPVFPGQSGAADAQPARDRKDRSGRTGALAHPDRRGEIMTAMLSARINPPILSVVLAIAAWLAMRRRILNAATRYLVWWAALAVTLALPLLYLPTAGIAPAIVLQQPEHINKAEGPAAVSVPI